MATRPQNIGIKAIEIYFPSQCVDQAELEKFDGVASGKYTIGLGQTKMSFCDDREDIYSLALTTLSSLIKKYNIDLKNIGRLEVGTETMLDKSKSVNEYPYVDGQFSLQCYTKAVDKCYAAYNAREQTLKARLNGHANGNGHKEESQDTPIDRFDYLAFHAPTCKLVSKSYARMLYNDFLSNPSDPAFAEVAQALRDIDYKASLTDKNVEKTFMALTKKRFQARVQPSIQVATQCGNMYCGSVYGGLVSLISNIAPKQFEGKRVGVFSYGSGLASALFSLKIVGDTSEMAEKLDLQKRLDGRKVVAPEVYDEMCLLREKAHLQKDFKPAGGLEDIRPGTYYLTEVDGMFRRQYEIKA
ncbi:Hydroxymethylglutaryl-CoA synthase [Cyphellophora attinorum]|uniref:Hydroxymethylglutaryl-CoA synthase n=1 Tax=Cyphellophora attinorum TaxID=1664694 RepID=A0A0N0NKY4_9EURO|nr:Hydroxymethylglutaryl-CoA synthase [Phialophora attinorum]KPI38558.1 Hydroxymethylglutaryl-CoA synthase [Phialophora attinorum]